MSTCSNSVAYGVPPYQSRLSDCLLPPMLPRLPWPFRSRSWPSRQPLCQEPVESFTAFRGKTMGLNGCDRHSDTTDKERPVRRSIVLSSRQLHTDPANAQRSWAACQNSLNTQIPQSSLIESLAMSQYDRAMRIPTDFRWLPFLAINSSRHHARTAHNTHATAQRGCVNAGQGDIHHTDLSN